MAISNSILHEVRLFEEKGKTDVNKYLKPSFHITAPIGWINDPNGFSLYKDEYHLFFQYHPFDIQWGPMHWGHMKTKDFITWQHLPIALAPDQSYDKAGCFSGTAIEDGGKHILMYTGTAEEIQPDQSTIIKQMQCIAIGNGLDYCKLDNNPVIDETLLPDGCSMEDFRDPKIWKEEEAFYALIANRSEDGSGQLILYQSLNLKEWKMCSILIKNNNEYGKMWECPDFFKLDDKYVIIVSPQEMQAKEYEIHNGNGSLYFIGDYDKNEYSFKRELTGVLDYGLDYYAPQTVETKDGRRVVIAWMQTWDNNINPNYFSWSGMMTLPREITILDGKIYQKPIKEIENYRHNPKQYSNYELSGQLSLPEISGREIDMEFEVISGNYQSVEIRLAANNEFHTSIIYNNTTNILTFDRKYSGLRKDVVCERQIKIGYENLKLRIIVDKYSAEVFVNDGEKVLSSLIYTTLEAQNIVFLVEGTIMVNINKYDIIVEQDD
ncbi:beta-fructofuranosidase [Lachnotalea glycerini]|uniref:Sucrose-6-phosphate hydrolase n=1 Tax=Lachnotalea glycerini TaxID=1763509 RepID=A0A255IB33_9FIRM|nr:glycoside hydrolase family 32 protein [Lachnotalea glycerini]PXV90288.1 beta-fructofuranosidase [Lachnotalea glycerini]RDY31041.1 glycoside hydrolase family 32 protein [Lachnotalea glycerini]